MLKIMLCSILHTRMTARIPLGDGCWSFQVWGCATLSRAFKTYCTFWLVLFQCFGFGNICYEGGQMLTERFIMVLNVFKGFYSPVYVAPWAMLGIESNSRVVFCWPNMPLLVTFRLGLLNRSQIREIILTIGIKKEGNWNPVGVSVSLCWLVYQK